MFTAVIVGTLRRLESLKSKQTGKYHSTEGRAWDVDIEAAAAEAAFAKYMDLFWVGGVNTFKDPDVGEFQVRHTTRADGSLIIRPSDDPMDTYVLVIGRFPKFRVVGYIEGRFARQDRFKRSPGGYPPAWFVPQEILRKFNSDPD
jgi:hypothetical protein